MKATRKCVHLDFHTSPLIEGIGKLFSREEFIKTLRAAKVDSMTVFAKCHHGYCYYPTKVGERHPHLDFDLLGEELSAIREAGAKAPVYITMGWCKKDSDEHPEWRHIDFATKKEFFFDNSLAVTDPERPLTGCSWTTLCPVGGYADHLAAITREICEMYDVSDGVFYDICFFKDACACEACCRGMRERGLDPENLEDAKKYYIEKRIEMMQTLTGIVHEFYPEAPVFYNGGANMNRPEFHPYETHYELEDLPTAWGGYDLMPLRAKYFERYGKYFHGMTGKFHHAWGEFGGFKNREALRYECADMLSVGASISVGDHLHPSGKIDESTYGIIGHAFSYIDAIEGYCRESRAFTDIALFMSHNYDADIGASKLLSIMQQEYDVVDSGDDLSAYRLVILPDHVKLTDADKQALLAYTARGGKLVASYTSVFPELGVTLLEPSPYDNDFISCPVDGCTTPFLSYSASYRVKTEGEVKAWVYDPYFSRTYGHFCGHKNTPYRTESSGYPALVECGNVLYFSHPVFTSYEKSGNYYLERYLIEAIDAFAGLTIRSENLPSCARVRFRKNQELGRFNLHVLYAPPVNRGNVCLLPDFPTLHDVRFSLQVDEKIAHVSLQPSGEEIPFTQKGSTVTLALPPFSLHTLVVLDKE